MIKFNKSASILNNDPKIQNLLFKYLVIRNRTCRLILHIIRNASVDNVDNYKY